MMAALRFLVPLAVLQNAAGIAVKDLTQSAMQEADKVQSSSDLFFKQVLDNQEAELLKLQDIAHPHDMPKPPELDFSKPVGGAAMTLGPALAMLEGLYESGKERIGDLNSKEEESKKYFDAKQKAHDQKLESIEAKFNTKKLSQKFHDDEIHDETRMWKYWSRVRTRQHRQYLSAVKIQHGTMSRTSKMIDLYKKAIAGEGKSSDFQDELNKVMASVHGGVGGAGKHLVLLQGKAMPECCTEELKLLAEERSKEF